MQIIKEIIDHSGQLRRKGSWLKPAGFVSAHPSFESAMPHLMLNDTQIRSLLADPDRVPSRQTYDVTWILNQGQYGSCNPTATAGALSRARYRRGLSKLLFSGAFLYSLINGGRDQGSALEDAMNAVMQYGIAPLSMVPPNDIYTYLIPAGAKAEAFKHRGLKAFAVGTQQGLRSALAAQIPCVTAIEAGNNYANATDGFPAVDSGPGDHAVCADDLCLIDGKEYFDSPGSWGGRFGVNGRQYLTWEHYRQTFPNHTFFAIASTDEAEE